MGSIPTLTFAYSLSLDRLWSKRPCPLWPETDLCNSVQASTPLSPSRLIPAINLASISSRCFTNIFRLENPDTMNSQLLPAAAAALCAVILLALMRHFMRVPPPAPLEHQDKSIPISISSSAVSTPGSDVEKGETPPPTASYFPDVKIKPESTEEVWPPVERETEEPAPTLAGTLPDVALVWGMDYRPAADRRPLMAYSAIASALGVEDEPVQTPPASATTNIRSMVSHRCAFTLGLEADFGSSAPAASEQQAWATLSEARASRSRGTHNIRILSILAWEANSVVRYIVFPTEPNVIPNGRVLFRDCLPSTEHHISNYGDDSTARHVWRGCPTLRATQERGGVADVMLPTARQA
ncbi:hypothetical protein AG1IA_07294 [Rhizoctonia solani AG-1 IA]|uniref:Uncharacterized protein n=1 Tax=Thanatephorus cucumeris (strain AG1-IA) TaxID=983506 RepID=L8WL64_THACA|nr:hypothetical protein AG1IA_07294 [Rhizoctonia solani AG-1 IA]